MNPQRPWGFRYFVRMRGYSSLYLFSVGGTRPVKVGITDDPLRRLGDFQVAHYHTVDFLRVWWLPGKPIASRIESAFKYHFIEEHIRGEWFAARFDVGCFRNAPARRRGALYRRDREHARDDPQAGQEAGQYLEAAADGTADIHFFQDIAEAAARCEGRLLIVGVLHQSFDQYARRFGAEMQEDWAKIQGRYVDTLAPGEPSAPASAPRISASAREGGRVNILDGGGGNRMGELNFRACV